MDCVNRYSLDRNVPLCRAERVGYEPAVRWLQNYRITHDCFLTPQPIIPYLIPRSSPAHFAVLNDFTLMRSQVLLQGESIKEISGRPSRQNGVRIVKAVHLHPYNNTTPGISEILIRNDLAYYFIPHIKLCRRIWITGDQMNALLSSLGLMRILPSYAAYRPSLSWCAPLIS